MRGLCENLIIKAVTRSAMYYLFMAKTFGVSVISVRQTEGTLYDSKRIIIQKQQWPQRSKSWYTVTGLGPKSLPEGMVKSHS